MSASEPPVALEGRYVVVRAARCVLLLSAEEIARLVAVDPETWIRALRRGKAYRRAEATRRRSKPMSVAAEEEA
jgi:hypothetical protein